MWGGVHIIHIFLFILKNVLYILCKTGDWYIPADYYSVTSHSDVNSCHCHMLVLKQNDINFKHYQTTCHINNWSWCCPHCVCATLSQDKAPSVCWSALHLWASTRQWRPTQMAVRVMPVVLAQTLTTALHLMTVTLPSSKCLPSPFHNGTVNVNRADLFYYPN